ncbi:glycolate oxidase subunit GlcE [Comamonas humi]
MDSTVSQMQERIRAAHASQTPLRIRGGGTKDFYGVRHGGDALDTRAHAGVVSYEPSELVVTVRSGTPLLELEQLLQQQGQCLPFEPPHFGPGATVGGMVAAGLSGPTRAAVGAVRDYVLGLGMLNGQGEHLVYGGQVMKNVAGYDVSRLMAGSWGTLGLLTEISLKVLPIPKAQATLYYECSQQQALHLLAGWRAQPLPINASLWQAVDDAPDAGYLMVRLRGAMAAVQAAVGRMGGQMLDHAQADAMWLACREQQLPWFRHMAPEHALWRLSVPATAPVLNHGEGLGSALLEWGGALRWLQAPIEHAHALQALARSVGGSAVCFRLGAAVRWTSSEDFGLAPASPALLGVHQRLKQAFDPRGIFNPGRLGDWAVA